VGSSKFRPINIIDPGNPSDSPQGIAIAGMMRQVERRRIRNHVQRPLDDLLATRVNGRQFGGLDPRGGHQQQSI